MSLTGVFRLRPSALTKSSRCTKNLMRTLSTAATEPEEKIEIPKRIPRGPTDILRALESTVSRDYTAAHYKYHDDPFLMPMSNLGKRSFAMAQEAGRKAALWVRQQHPELFQHREADPMIEDYIPKMVYTENSDVSVEDLCKTISDVQVTDAILIYKLLVGKGEKIDPELVQALLELVCFHNSEDTLADDLIEERWFSQSSKSKERTRKTWKDGGFAEELFITLDKPDTQAYSAIIQGMAKHFQVDRAWELFQEAEQKGVILNTEAYNAILSVTNIIKEGHEMRWSLVINLLSQMDKARLRPNLGTLNAVLLTLRTMGSSRNTKTNMLKTLAEFKKLGIEPSLGSWYYLLITFCKERGPVSTILNDIMREIENKEHQIRDLKDTYFFVTAMDICRNHLGDPELAKRVDKLLHYGNNYDLIGDSFKESIYYRHYFLLLSETQAFEDFMSIYYDKLVPHIYVPEPLVMAEVLTHAEASGAVDHIPRLWSDMVMFDHVYRENLLQQITAIMVDNEPPQDSELHGKFAKIAQEIYERIAAANQRQDRVATVSFTGELLGRIMTLLLRGKNFKKACEVMEKLDKGHSSFSGIPSLQALSLFVDACIEEKAPSYALMCIQYCVDCGFPEAKQMAAKLNDKLTLDERYIEKLTRMVGDLSIASQEAS